MTSFTETFARRDAVVGGGMAVGVEEGFAELDEVLADPQA